MTSTVAFDVPESVHGIPCGTFLDIGLVGCGLREFVGVYQEYTSGQIMLAYWNLPITSVTVRRPGSHAVTAVRRDSVVAGALFDTLQAVCPSATLDASLLRTGPPP